MKNEKLNRVFDRVKLSQEREEAMLADLLREKKEVSSMKQTNRRRIPAAALVAAALAAVLAGTAVAREIYGHVTVMPQASTDGSQVKSVQVYGSCDYIPAESLPEEVLAMGEETGEYGTKAWAFASRTECGTFLGLSLMDNPVLDRLPPRAGLDISALDKDLEGSLESNVVDVFYLDRQPRTVSVWSFYGDDSYELWEQVVIHTDLNDLTNSWDRQMDLMEGAEVTTENYVTPGGLEATIITEVQEDLGNIRHTAHFASSTGLYMLQYTTVRAGNQSQSDLDSLEMLKEILDAYE